eukprot:scaffold879_cov410-Prasinococcus_capsulatus_cf.AAC.36
MAAAKRAVRGLWSSGDSVGLADLYALLQPCRFVATRPAVGRCEPRMVTPGPAFQPGTPAPRLAAHMAPRASQKALPAHRGRARARLR